MDFTKLDRLRGVLEGYGSCLVAYSGGVDSAFLARIAFDVLGDRALAAIADSPSLPRGELDEALKLGVQFGFPVEIVRTAEFEDDRYLENPTDRCFFCKEALFSRLAPLASERGIEVIAYGENASDAGDHRPGARAALQFDVRAPLKEAGLTKDDVRRYSRHLGLPTAEKPQMACLSSRIPYGERVTPEKLRMVEAGENWLRVRGLSEVRVRHHESDDRAGTGRRFLARIELGEEDLAVFCRKIDFGAVAAAFREIGYGWVTLDLQTYRRGRMNEGVAPPTGNPATLGG